MNQPSAAAKRALKAAAAKTAPSEDKLEKVRDELRKARDNDLLIADLEQKLGEANASKVKLIRETLPTLFQEVGVDKLGLAAEGNLPAYDCTLAPYYKASIPASWPQEKQDEAFAWLDENGHGDIIKNTFVVELPKGSDELSEKVEEALNMLLVPFTQKRAVNWNTLTAFVKEQVEKENTTPPLEILGADVGNIVKLKERKER